MSFQAISVRQESLPWSWPLRLDAEAPQLRLRAVITALDDKGRRHEAELSPCPGVHPEVLEDALGQWRRDVETLLTANPFAPERWNWIRPAFGLCDLPSGIFSSVLSALEQLILSWAQVEHPEEFSLPAAVTLEGSALLALQVDAGQSWQEFLQLWNEGFRVFKCKVGRLPAAHEYDLLQKMNKHGAGHLRLRLDANRGMDPDAISFWRERQASLPIVYWEEAAGLQPQALDETVWDQDEVPKASTWILKPTRLGLSRTIAVLKKARTQGIPCVLSNAFDSGLTLRSSAWIYAAFCVNPQPLGYGTTRFLPADAWDSEKWGQAQVLIPRHPFSQGEDA
jgi:O-succinylbenzoate synthase